MVKRIRNIFFLLSTTICFSYCVKKTEAPKPNYGNYTPPINLADYCYFKTGSYWVYQDSVSLKLDSVYVQNAYIQTYEITASDNKDYIGTFHHYYMKTIDGYGDEREYDIYDEDAAESAKCCQGRYFCEVHWNRPSTATKTGIYFGYYVHMFNNFTNGVTGGHGICCSGSQGDECWSRGSNNSMNVNSVNYSNIVTFEYLKIGGLAYPFNYGEKNYISKNIGTIKRIRTDSSVVYKLKRYNVVQ